MKPNHDAPSLLQPWHLDCRLENELPEDKVVGTRFLTNTILGAATAALLLLFAWLVYWNLNLRSHIREWDHRVAMQRPEMLVVERLQGEYIREAVKIDKAYELMHSPLLVSGFTAQLGRTRPDKMILDIIESIDPTTIVARGSLRETSERASRLLGHYLDTLRQDAQIGPHFKEILLTGLDRTEKSDDLLSFEITFRLR